MSGEKFPTGGSVGFAGPENVNGDFAQIVQQNFDPTYEEGPAPQEPTVPFGQFTEAPGDQLDERRAPMATSTGYTGNNAEESA